jgi:molybdate transport system substrate-binding protein
MKSPARRLAAAFSFALAIASFTACEKNEPAGGGTPAPATVTLSIGAASSLKELVEATRPAFERAHAGVTFRVSFDASSALSRQIEAGGGFDCLLSADAANVDRLGAKIDAASRVRFLSNRLVVVARADLAPPLTGLEGLKALAGKLALAGEAVPVGKYARAWLTRKGLLKDLEPKVVNAENVRAVLALVEAGSADAGVVYATDARVAVHAKVAFAVAAEDDPGIEYVAAAVAGSSAIAHAYVAWLRSAEFQDAAEKLGFVRVAQ